MTTVEIIGYLGTFMITVCYIPQVIHTSRTKDVTGISLGMYCALAVGVGLWLVYGVMREDTPLILCNGISLLMIISILIMKVMYTKKDSSADSLVTDAN